MVAKLFNNEKQMLGQCQIQELFLLAKNEKVHRVIRITGSQFLSKYLTIEYRMYMYYC